MVELHEIIKELLYKKGTREPEEDKKDYYVEKLSLGIRKFTIATFAGSIATIDIPESLILIFTSLTISEIIAITSENAFGLSNFALMFIDSQDTFKLYCSELTKGI